jgi:hypothetical protein
MRDEKVIKSKSRLAGRLIDEAGHTGEVNQDWYLSSTSNDYLATTAPNIGRRHSEFAQYQIEIWQRQFSNRPLTKQQQKLLSYFTKGQGRHDHPQRNWRAPSCRLFRRKVVV